MKFQRVEEGIGVIILILFFIVGIWLGWVIHPNCVKPGADLNEDGIVDMTDYSILMSQLEE